MRKSTKQALNILTSSPDDPPSLDPVTFTSNFDSSSFYYPHNSSASFKPERTKCFALDASPCLFDFTKPTSSTPSDAVPPAFDTYRYP